MRSAAHARAWLITTACLRELGSDVHLRQLSSGGSVRNATLSAAVRTAKARHVAYPTLPRALGFRRLCTFVLAMIGLLTPLIGHRATCTATEDNELSTVECSLHHASLRAKMYPDANEILELRPSVPGGVLMFWRPRCCLS
jgi:hypothetical protein